MFLESVVKDLLQGKIRTDKDTPQMHAMPLTESLSLLSRDSSNDPMSTPLLAAEQMENGAYEDSGVEDRPSNASVVESSTTPPTHSCKCEEEQAECHCKKFKSPQTKIELRPWSSSKGYLLIGVIASLVVWGAVFFTLLCLDYV